MCSSDLHHRKLVSEGIVYNGPEKETREPAAAEETRESPTPAAPAVTEEQAREMALAAARAERGRVEEIRGLCVHFGVPEDRARALIDGNKNLDEARAAVLEYLKASNQPFGAAIQLVLRWKFKYGFVILAPTNRGKGSIS